MVKQNLPHQIPNVYFICVYAMIWVARCIPNSNWRLTIALSQKISVIKRSEINLRSKTSIFSKCPIHVNNLTVYWLNQLFCAIQIIVTIQQFNGVSIRSSLCLPYSEYNAVHAWHSCRFVLEYALWFLSNDTGRFLTLYQYYYHGSKVSTMKLSHPGMDIANNDETI